MSDQLLKNIKHAMELIIGNDKHDYVELQTREALLMVIRHNQAYAREVLSMIENVNPG
jgi:hypothetical protein